MLEQLNCMCVQEGSVALVNAAPRNKMTPSLNHYANGQDGRGISVRAGTWETRLLGSHPTPSNISHCDPGQVAELHCTLVLFLHLQTQANNSYLHCRGGTKINELMSRACCGEKVGCRNVIISTNLWFAQGLPQQLFWMLCSFPSSSLIMNLYVPFLLLWDMDALVQEVMSSSMASKPGCSVKMIRRESLSHRMMEIGGRYKIWKSLSFKINK